MDLNSAKMNLDYIRTFVILVQSRNMTQASQKLNVTFNIDNHNSYRPNYALNYKTPIEYRTQLGFN